MPVKGRVYLALDVEARDEQAKEELLDMLVDAIRGSLEVVVESSTDVDSWQTEDGKDTSMVDHFGHFDVHLTIANEIGSLLPRS